MKATDIKPGHIITYYGKEITVKSIAGINSGDNAVVINGKTRISKDETVTFVKDTFEVFETSFDFYSIPVTTRAANPKEALKLAKAKLSSIVDVAKFVNPHATFTNKK